MKKIRIFILRVYLKFILGFMKWSVKKFRKYMNNHDVYEIGEILTNYYLDDWDSPIEVYDTLGEFYNIGSDLMDEAVRAEAPKIRRLYNLEIDEFIPSIIIEDYFEKL